ncbi:hypothetical protein WM40_24035 [Robbsia andropogonis]|uniref:Uncharacterized protein n=1 Tax=Robbsia andropogonis TaxID=28092 RepID=A0A0F5JTY1_9BURK|nr:hypothetical protein WM40_24035 [Robbsia andropogonis]
MQMSRAMRDLLIILRHIFARPLVSLYPNKLAVSYVHRHFIGIFSWYENCFYCVVWMDVNKW